MYSFRIIASISLLGFSPFFVGAEGGYIGENPGTNFYSTIDAGDYQITTKILSKRLAEKPTLDKFGAECIKSSWVKNAPTEIKTLEEISNGNYRKLTEILEKNGVKDATTDKYHELVLCLTAKYQETKARARDEQGNIEKLSSLGLYMDGDTTNSDYDIISDIGKINMIIFSKDIKYSGEKNNSSSAFQNFLAGKSVGSLFGPDTPPDIVGNSGDTINPPPIDENGDGIPDTTGSGVNLETLIGGTCGGSTTSRDISDMIDDAFARELEATLTRGTLGYPTGEGYTRNVGEIPRDNGSGSSTNSTNTSASDFFHKMPCTSIFCIDVTMVSGSQDLLGGGKNISIEGLLDKHTEIMGKISETALRCEKMTNNFGSFPASRTILEKILAGAHVYIKTKTQNTRRNKEEQTPDREKTELEDARRCAFVGAGLNTDSARANSLLGAGYSPTSASNTENVDKTKKILGPQETELSRYVGCLDANINTGRKSYYESFSTDLTEIQAYTSSMMNEIKEILDIGAKMNVKPTQCPG